VGLGFAGDASLQKAKQEAETKGYLFETRHDDIVAKAKKEAKLKVFSALDAGRTLKELSERFKAKYPFLADMQWEEKGASEMHQRFLMEIKAGLAKGWDAVGMRSELHSQYLPHLKKFDILGMAHHGVLEIPHQVVDPAARNIVAITSDIQVVGYNKKLISADKVPAQWEDFLKPEFKGRKFCADIRPVVLSALVPVWGMEKVMDMARKIAAQEPVWVRGYPRALTAVAAGEYAMFMGPNFGAVKVLQSKAVQSELEYKVIEPAPVRLNQGTGVLDTSEHPYTALLWLEFLTSPEAQKIIDKHEPGEASLFGPGSIQGDVIRGKKLSIVQWDAAEKMDGWQKELVKAYGFPNAEVK
jgi:ABC-type thiamine transport system substrate-binding protein